MNELQNFNFKGAEVRGVLIDNKPYLVAKDVAKFLGYKRTADAIKAHVPDKDKGVGEIQTPGGKQKIILISESGMYHLVFASKLPGAEQFTDWVTSEVLPAIRKHGAYLTDKKAADIVTNKDALADLLKQASDQLKAKDLQIAEMRPKALFADAVTESNTTILVGDLAKLIKQNGVNMGQRRLFKWLRDNHYLISRRGADYNSPTQRSMEMGLFEIKESTHVNGAGVVITTRTPKVTGKGQQYFINKFLKEA